MKKHLKILAIAGVITIASATTSLAGQWKQNDIGWWYQEDDGSYSINSWKELNGKWYYFNQDGYMSVNTWVGNYYLGSDGSMLMNTTTPDGYKVGSDGAWIQDKERTGLYLKDDVKWYFETPFTEIDKILVDKQCFTFAEIWDPSTGEALGTADIKASNIPYNLYVDYHGEIGYPEKVYDDYIKKLDGPLRKCFDGFTKDEYTYQEMIKLLTESGFTNVDGVDEDWRHEYGGINGSPGRVETGHSTAVSFQVGDLKCSLSGNNSRFSSESYVRISRNDQ